MDRLVDLGQRDGRRRRSAVAAHGFSAALLGGLAALLQVALVVLLGGVEPLRRQDLGDDLVLPLLLLLRQRRARQRLLLRRVVVDARPVLRPDVLALTTDGRSMIDREVLDLNLNVHRSMIGRTYLSVERGGVDLCPEDVEERGVGAGLGVVVQAHRLGVPGAVAADELVRGGLVVALRVPDLRARHAGEALVRQLHAPEATRRELRQFQAIARRGVRVRCQVQGRRRVRGAAVDGSGARRRHAVGSSG